MTLQECREQIAHKYEFKNWEEAEFHPPFMWEEKLVGESDLADELLKLYASEKVKEALKGAAERGRGYSVGNAIDKQTILSLETELLNNIDKEI